MAYLRAALVGAAMCAASAPAGATLVTSIKITSPYNDYIQVSEVVATQAGTGADVALASAGATASAANSAYGTNPDTAIDGVGPAPYPAIYHSAGNAGDYLLVTLAQAFDITSLTIDGRQDTFGNLRDYYGFELYNGTTLVDSGTIDARNDAHTGTAILDAASAVPEPATWAMFIGGFGLIGGTLRRRERAAVRFA